MKLLTTLALCLLTFAPLARGEDPATRPSTRPANERKVIRISAPLEGSDTPLVVLVDVNDAPEAEAWAKASAEYAIKWYPALEKALASEGFTPSREFRLVFKPVDGVASTTGNVITINSDWIRKHPDDRGMVAHELVHVIQHYRRGEGWLTEGIADYLRYYVVEPGSKQAGFDAKRQTYKGGYQPAAAMLNWIEKTKGPGVISKLNQAMRKGKYSGELFKELTGGTPDEVWELFKATLKTKKAA